MLGSLGTTTAAAIVIESTSTASTASLGTNEVFFRTEGPSRPVEPFLDASAVDPKRFGMLRGILNLISGLAMSEDFSTPDNNTAGL